MGIIYKKSKKSKTKEEKLKKKINALKKFADDMNRRSVDFKFDRVPFVQTR